MFMSAVDTIKHEIMKPYIGVGAPVGGFWLTMIDTLSPFLRFAALIIGLLVGIASLILYILRIRDELRKKDRR